MERLIAFFTYKWQQKTVAFIIGLILWLFVNHSLTETKTLPYIPIRVVNLPEDKTISGIMPNGMLNKRLSLTISGSKKVIDEIEPGDLEIVVDASTFDQDEQVLRITKKNLISLNPNLDISDSVQTISHPELIVKLSQLVTGRIPITILPPKGQPPQGYVYLDIWPQKLMQTITGPEEQVEALAAKGIELHFDLSDISKRELDRIKTSRENFHDDEVSFFIPASWKKVAIPFRSNALEEINDPEAQNLHIDFLRKETFAIDRDIPVRIYYPLMTSDVINPSNLALDFEAGGLKVQNKIPYIPNKLYVKNVSRRFLEVIRDYLIISIIAENDKTELSWGISVIAPQELENKYVSYLISHHNEGKSSEPRHSKKRENHLRARFRNFIQKLTLYLSQEKRLGIEAVVENNKVRIQTVPIFDNARE